MASSLISSWQIDGKQWKQWQTVLGLQNHCKWWLQPWNWKTLSLWKKSYDKPRQHIKKQRHHFADKSLYSQSYGFSSSHVWMWDLNHKEAECWRTDTFEFVMWEKILESPLDYKEINQLIQKQISPEYSLEGLLLKLKLQYFGHLMQKADSFEKTLMLGKIEGRKRSG